MTDSTKCPPTVRELRRRWKPWKECLRASHPNHPTPVRLHRAFSWMQRVESVEDGQDIDLQLVCRWVAFNALYGQWDEQKQEPRADRQTWRRFLERIAALDADGCLSAVLRDQETLVMSIFDDAFVTTYYWEDPSEERADKSRNMRRKVQEWYREERWSAMLDKLVDRIYLVRCQLVHGAATFGGKLNRESLDRCASMLAHLLPAMIVVLIDHGKGDDWGAMCYPPRNNDRPASERKDEPRP